MLNVSIVRVSQISMFNLFDIKDIVSGCKIDFFVLFLTLNNLQLKHMPESDAIQCFFI